MCNKIVKKIMISLLFLFITFANAGNRFIIKFKSDGKGASILAESSNFKQIHHANFDKISKLNGMKGYSIRRIMPLANGAKVVILQDELTQTQMDQLLTKLKADSKVLYVQEDTRLHHMGK